MQNYPVTNIFKQLFFPFFLRNVKKTFSYSENHILKSRYFFLKELVNKPNFRYDLHIMLQTGTKMEEVGGWGRGPASFIYHMVFYRKLGSF